MTSPTVWWTSSLVMCNLVDHVPDQEQTPASRRLQPFQLGLQVRHFLIGSRVTDPALIVDAHRQIHTRREYLDNHRHLGPIPVTMLHGVHRRLGPGGLEPLEALLRKT